VVTLIIEMMRFCSKCGDYYTDDSLAFCLVDGMPLVDVNPLSEIWREGTRVIEEKENALRKQKRKMKWRRVLLSVMTMLIAIMVVIVVAVNSFIYLNPQQEDVVPDKPLMPATAPGGLSASNVPSAPGEPASTPTPWLRATPRPTASPVAAKIITPTPTPTPAPRPSPLPALKPTPTPSPSPRPTASPSPQLTIAPAPKCTDADKSREREAIIRRFGDRWRRNIEGERNKVIARNAPSGADNALTGVNNAEASLGPIEYQITFPDACMPGFVRARYVWQIRTNVNGTIKVATVAQEKRYTCAKIGGVWFCN
jgi:outer membrane biosynthesis protein TonB